MFYSKLRFIVDPRKTSRVGISVIFTNEENIGRRRDSLYPSPIHEITSSAESSPAPMKKMTPKYSMPQRKRGIVSNHCFSLSFSFKR